MTHYQPPQIGHTPETAKRLDAMGWPNALLGASDGEIALAYQAWQAAREQRRDNRIAFWAVAACTVSGLVVAGLQVWGWV